MAHKKRTLSGIGVLLSLLWLAACSPSVQTSTPTLDQNPLRTEVASTVFAQVTQALASTPSVTPLPTPTATNPPTSTPRPTVHRPAQRSLYQVERQMLKPKTRPNGSPNPLQMTPPLPPARPSP
jgi:hypothetical protein